VPVISAAREFADMGIIPEGSYKNREFASKFVSGKADILLYDAQTSGGLLLAVPQSEANLALSRLKEAGYESSAVVGVAKKNNKFKGKRIKLEYRNI
jgi:selenide, water dikinase